MRYVSTRGEAPELGFSDVLLAGLAQDGGLYVPTSWPQISPDEIATFSGASYADVAYRVIQPYVGSSIEDEVLRTLVQEAYSDFGHPAVAPLVQIAPNHFLLELFHGPTLAFKDVAMQLLARLMDHVLQQRGQRATVVGATSGDTGGAAISAFAGRQRTHMFILFPKGRVSTVQRRQMTTEVSDNVHCLEIDGTFDDCQALVKAMFADKRFRDRVALAGVNSINWARIVAQIVYYFTAAVALGGPGRAVSFTVPTGNFGDIFAGYAAKKMGLPIDRLVIASNVNDILPRTLETGVYDVRGVAATQSPSMDIQVSSNFERLLYLASGREAETVARWMANLKQSGSFTLDPQSLEAITAEFDAGRTTDADTSAVMTELLTDCDYLLDPHTAVGVFVAERCAKASIPMITLGTAHPAKFPAAVEAATGVQPPLPTHLGDLMEREERMTPLPNDLDVVERFIEQHSSLLETRVS